MALRDTSWIISGTTMQTANAVTISYLRHADEGMFLTNGSHITSTHRVVVKEWMAVTHDAAKKVVDTKAANPDTNTTYSMRQTNRVINAWVLVQTVDSRSPWLLDT